jgi:hypothetical protein
MLVCVYIHTYTHARTHTRTHTHTHDAAALSGPGPPHCRGFTITLRYATLFRTPLEEWSAWRRDLYLKTYNCHKRLTFMHPAVFEPTYTGKRAAADRTATGFGPLHFLTLKMPLYVYSEPQARNCPHSLTSLALSPCLCPCMLNNAHFPETHTVGPYFNTPCRIYSYLGTDLHLTCRERGVGGSVSVKRKHSAFTINYHRLSTLDTRH